MKNRFAPPVPEVQYLSALFRKIQNGELKIPAFQRGFVWREKDILKLMESIYLGYPVGSLLFWKTESGKLKEIDNLASGFPSAENTTSNDVSYVLDGMQRLSSLYGAFHSSEYKDDKFKIAYDFDENRFYIPQSEEGFRENSLPLEHLFLPRELIAFQSKVLGTSGGDEIISKSLELQSIFQEYLIPTITISGRSINDVVEIFSRVNSTGVRLDVVDFMRALTWSTSFDLTEEVEKLMSMSSSLNFKIVGQTFVKLIAMCSQRETTAESMFKMSEMSADQLHEAVKLAGHITPRVIENLRGYNKIVDSELLGYEGQFLIWAAFLLSKNKHSTFSEDEISSIVWQIGFGEILRGKPDHFLERILQKIYKNEHDHIVAAPKIEIDLFSSRRFLNGKALSSSFVGMFTHRAGQYGCVFTSSDLKPALTVKKKFGGATSDKFFANLIIPAFGDVSLSQAYENCNDLFSEMKAKLSEENFKNWCQINFIDHDDLPGSVDDFIRQRSFNMATYAKEICRV